MQKFDRIMVLEDDEIASFLIKKSILKVPSVQSCLTFENGEPALKWLMEAWEKKEPLPTLIFIDVNMPVMDGWEFLTQLRTWEEFSTIPSVVLTSSVNPADKETASQFPNIWKFLSKPLTKQVLEAMLSELGKPLF
jgi:CheY-like chemotaxis protein